MTEQTTFEFDPHRQRPLELRVRDMSDEGGISEADAARYGRVAADALVIVRFLTDPDRGISVSLHSLNGKTLEGLSVEAQFTAWLSYTAYLARQATAPDDARRRTFLLHVLHLLQLDEKLNLIQAAEPDPESHCARSDEAPATLD
jgi:hypothetical protein